MAKRPESVKAKLDRLDKARAELPEDRQAALLQMLNTMGTSLEELANKDPDLHVVSLKEIGQVYRLTNRTLLSKVKTGELKAARVGRRYMVTISALKEFLRRGKK